MGAGGLEQEGDLGVELGGGHVKSAGGQTASSGLGRARTYNAHIHLHVR